MEKDQSKDILESLTEEQKRLSEVIIEYLRRLDSDWRVSELVVDGLGEESDVFHKNVLMGHFSGHAPAGFWNKVFRMEEEYPFVEEEERGLGLYEEIKGEGIGIALYVRYYLEIKKHYPELLRIESCKRGGHSLSEEAEGVYRRFCMKGLFTYDKDLELYISDFTTWCTPEVVEALEREVSLRGVLPEYKDRMAQIIASQVGGISQEVLDQLR